MASDVSPLRLISFFDLKKQRQKPPDPEARKPESRYWVYIIVLFDLARKLRKKKGTITFF